MEEHVSFIQQVPCPYEKSSWYLSNWVGGLLGHRVSLDTLEERKSPTLPGIKQFLSCLSWSLVITLTGLSWLLLSNKNWDLLVVVTDQPWGKAATLSCRSGRREPVRRRKTTDLFGSCTSSKEQDPAFGWSNSISWCGDRLLDPGDNPWCLWSLHCTYHSSSS